MKKITFVVTLLMSLVLCSCSQKVDSDALSTNSNIVSSNHSSEANIVEKQFFKVNNYSPKGTEEEGMTKSIYLSDGPFYYFKNNLCSYWSKSTDEKSSYKYAVAICYYKIIDGLVFLNIPEDPDKPVVESLNATNDLTDEYINSFQNQYPLTSETCFEYLCDFSGNLLLFYENSRISEYYVTVEIANELGMKIIA